MVLEGQPQRAEPRKVKSRSWGKETVCVGSSGPGRLGEVGGIPKELRGWEGCSALGGGRGWWAVVSHLPFHIA